MIVDLMNWSDFFDDLYYFKSLAISKCVLCSVYVVPYKNVIISFGFFYRPSILSYLSLLNTLYVV